MSGSLNSFQHLCQQEENYFYRKTFFPMVALGNGLLAIPVTSAFPKQCFSKADWQPGGL